MSEDTYLSRILQFYDSKTDNFQKIFNLLLGLSLVFFILIVLTYSYVKWVEYDMSGQLKKLDTNIDTLQKYIANYSMAKNGTQELKQRLLNNTDIKNGPFQPINFGQFVPPKKNDHNTLTLQKEIQKQFQEHKQILNNNVSKPLTSLESNKTLVNDLNKILNHSTTKARNTQESVMPINIATLSHEINTLQQTIQNNLNNAKIIQSPVANDSAVVHNKNLTEQSQNATFLVIPNKKMNNTITELHKITDQSIFTLEKKIQSFKKLRDPILKNFAKANATEHELAAALKQYNTPLGQIPIGLDKAIGFFPITLAVIFLICTYLLRGSIRLRMEYHYTYRINNTKSNELADHQIAHYAPLWIDPGDSLCSRIIKFILLTVPFVISLLSISLIMYTWTLVDNIVMVDEFDRKVYAASFVVSGIIFSYGIYLILRLLSEYYPKDIKKNLIDKFESSVKQHNLDGHESMQNLRTMLWKVMYDLVNKEIDSAINGLDEFRKGIETGQLMNADIKKPLIKEAEKAKKILTNKYRARIYSKE